MEEQSDAIAILNLAGESIRAVVSPFKGQEVNSGLLQRVITSHLGASRGGNAATKTRSFINVTGKKPYKQKGTGRARAGGADSPLWVGGGVAHGPQPRKYGGSVNKKVRSRVLLDLFTLFAKNKRIGIIESSSKSVIKSFELRGLLTSDGRDRMRITLCCTEGALRLGSRNFPNVEICGPDQLGPYQLSRSSYVLFEESAFDQFLERRSIEVVSQ
jgi:large subunit ribosomal protein L4